MNRLVIPSILAITVLVAGIFALMPVEKASTVHTSIIAAAARAMTLITDISIAAGDRVVLLDNAGIGGTSNVEVTWRFSDADCRVVTVGGTISAGGAGAADAELGTLLQNDGALGGDPPHADVTGTNAIILRALAAGACDMTHALGDFVTVTVVGGA